MKILSEARKRSSLHRPVRAAFRYWLGRLGIGGEKRFRYQPGDGFGFFRGGGGFYGRRFYRCLNGNRSWGRRFKPNNVGLVADRPDLQAAPGPINSPHQTFPPESVAEGPYPLPRQADIRRRTRGNEPRLSRPIPGELTPSASNAGMWRLSAWTSLGFWPAHILSFPAEPAIIPCTIGLMTAKSQV